MFLAGERPAGGPGLTRTSVSPRRKATATLRSIFRFQHDPAAPKAPQESAATSSRRERLLVIKLGALGDIFLATGALQDIRLHHPSAMIAVLTRAPYREVMERCPWVDEVLCDDNAPRWRLGQMWQLARRLRAGSFDRVYDLQGSRRSRFYVRWLLRANRDGPIQRAEPDRSRLARSMQPVLMRHARQLACEGVPAKHVVAPDLTWMCARVDDLLRNANVGQPYVVLLPGSSKRHAYKRWPHYPDLAAGLHQHRVTVVTVPGPEEPELGDHFVGTCLRARGGALDLFALAGVLQGAAFVVGNDSGPTHMAALLGLPGVALFGGSIAPSTTSISERRLQAIHAPGFAGIDASRVLDLLRDAGLLGRIMPRRDRHHGDEAVPQRRVQQAAE